MRWLIHDYILKPLWIDPLRTLYFSGPALFGFYNGLADEDICASMTKVPSDHWAQNTDQCDLLLDRNFYSFQVLIQSVVYFGLLAYLVFILILRYCIVRPVVRECIKNNVDKN